MFQVLSGRKRRVISPATIAASVAAHLLLLGGAVYAAASDPAPREQAGPVIDLNDFPQEPTPPEPLPAPPPPEPPAPEEEPREDVPGATLQVDQVTKVPDQIQPEPPGVVPVDPADYSGDGPIGNRIGTPPPVPTPAPPAAAPAGPGEFIPDEGMVEERPVLDRDGLARTLGRYYPSVLRDSRVAGRVVIEMVVDADGRVREGSARVVETSHAAFGEAAVRAVERFRFRPARMGGVPVPVRVTLPIQWTVPD